ncbi:MAG: sodium-dependent transporter [Alphaproteobacteria bacterium]
MAQARESWKSRGGFIIAAAGSAVGLGNIWRFPYVAGENGGGAFIILYLAIVFTVGFSIFLAEQTIGRAAQRSPAAAFRRLKGGVWPILGYIGVLCAVVILPFYSVVGGWTLGFIWKSIAGTASDAGGFGAFISHGWLPILFHGLFMAATATVVIAAINQGIERWCRILLPGLVILMFVLIIRSVSLSGAEKGIAFFLTPDFSKVTIVTVQAALSQAFFSISVGMGVMITYGSYISLDRSLPGDAAWVVGLDSSFAIMAGLIILPAVFAFGQNPSAGPALTFVTLPQIFSQISGGIFFGILFFLMLSVAALTSAISILEVAVAHLGDEHNVSRHKGTIWTGFVLFLVGIPASLSFGPWADITLFGMTIFDLMDFFATKLLLPGGAIGMALFVGWVFWPDAAKSLYAEGEAPPRWAFVWRWMCAIIAPVLILWVMIGGF